MDPQKKLNEEDQILTEMSRRSKSYGRWFQARQPKKINKVVAQLMQRRGYAQAENARILEEAWQTILANLGDSQRMSTTTRVGVIRRGVLEILVANSLMMQELAFQKQTILGAMQQAYPEGKIQKIRFRVGNIN